MNERDRLGHEVEALLDAAREHVRDLEGTKRILGLLERRRTIEADTEPVSPPALITISRPKPRPPDGANGHEPVKTKKGRPKGVSIPIDKEAVNRRADRIRALLREGPKTIGELLDDLVGPLPRDEKASGRVSAHLSTMRKRGEIERNAAGLYKLLRVPKPHDRPNVDRAQRERDMVVEIVTKAKRPLHAKEILTEVRAQDPAYAEAKATARAYFAMQRSAQHRRLVQLSDGRYALPG